MDRDQKNEMDGNFDLIELAIKDMGAPYRATTKALATLKIIRDEAFDGDVVFCGCIGCEYPIWESEMESATSIDDGWVCVECIEQWKP